VKISDSQLYAVLANLLDGTGVATIHPRNAQSNEFEIRIATEVHDNHRGDSPDVILWLNLEIVNPRLPVLKLRIPVPMEGERAGIGAAIEDLRKFADRQHFALKLPMLVVGGDGNPARSSQTVSLPAKVEITQVPYRAVAE
jgi:hypothetical protein